MRFRLGALGLKVQHGLQPGVRYMLRYCTRCQPNAVDTQQHCLFACGCPELVSARNSLFDALSVGGGPNRVGDLFDRPERTVGQHRQVVGYVAYCWRHVMSHPAVSMCVGPCWEQQQQREVDIGDRGVSTSCAVFVSCRSVTSHPACLVLCTHSTCVASTIVYI
jgi:hypothetical protein